MLPATQTERLHRYMPAGVRVLEKSLLREYGADEVVACFPDDLDKFIGPNTRVVAVSLPGGQEFVFTDNGKTVGPRARSLKQFVLSLTSIPATSLDGHARRGDFSQWIEGIFHDHRLASDIRKIEQRYRFGHLADVRQSMSRLIQERYKFSHGRVS